MQLDTANCATVASHVHSIAIREGAFMAKASLGDKAFNRLE